MPTLNQTLSNIADSIRSKTGQNGTMTPSQMGGKIQQFAAATPKYGVTIDSIVGNVDSNGILQQPNKQYVLTLNGVTSIEQGDFSNTSLSSPISYFYYDFQIIGVDFPDLQTIGNNGLSNAATYTDTGYGVFQQATKISQMSAPNLTSIGNYGMMNTFRRDSTGSSGLTSVSFPKLTTVGNSGLNNTFYYQKYLTSVSLPLLSSVGQYGLYRTFMNCTALTTVDLHSITSVSNSNSMSYTFEGCTSLSSVNISGITTISQNMSRTFYGCTNLKSIDLSHITTITSGGFGSTFYGSGLQTVNLSNLTTVPTGASFSATFRNCTSLTSADISNITYWYGTYAFYGCTSLKTVKLNKVSTTGGTNGFGFGSTFYGCSALEVVDFREATAVPAIPTTTFSNTNSTFKVVVPDALYSTWIAASNWSAISSQIIKLSDYIAQGGN